MKNSFEKCDKTYKKSLEKCDLAVIYSSKEERMTKLCQKCSKRFLCKEVDTKEECNNFKSWRETKNYGEVKHGGNK